MKEPEEQFLHYIITSIVDYPDDVIIERTVDNMGVLLTLTVNPQDMGRVIGKEGKMAQLALRPLLHAVGMKHNARVNLKINEPLGSKREVDAEDLKTVDQIVDELS